jgi:hypothetical protein
LQEIRGLRAAITTIMGDAKYFSHYEQALIRELKDGQDKPQPKKVKPQNLLAMLLSSGVKLK